MKRLNKRNCLCLALAFVLAVCCSACGADNEVSELGTWVEQDTSKLEETEDYCFKWDDTKTVITGLTYDGMRESELVIPAHCEEIDTNDLSENSQLERIAFANPDTAFGDNFGGFLNCENLAEIRFPDNLAIIPSYCCGGCEKLTTVVFPSGLSLVEEGAFLNCMSLRSAIFDDALTTIDCNAFQDCVYLSEVRLGNGIQRINARAFAGCSSLKNVEMPSTLDSLQVDETAFEDTPFLDDVSGQLRELLLGQQKE